MDFASYVAALASVLAVMSGIKALRWLRGRWRRYRTRRYLRLVHAEARREWEASQR